jgi:hypothetical protein
MLLLSSPTFFSLHVIYVNRMSKVVGVRDPKSVPSQGSEMGPFPQITIDQNLQEIHQVGLKSGSLSQAALSGTRMRPLWKSCSSFKTLGEQPVGPQSAGGSGYAERLTKRR